MQLTSHISIE